jgi:hypothetical protein
LFYLFIVAVKVVFTLSKRYKGGLVVFVNLGVWPRYFACFARSACDNLRDRDGARLGGTDIRLEFELDANYDSVNSDEAIFYIFNGFGELFYDVCDFVVGFPLEIWFSALEGFVAFFDELYEKMELRSVADRLKGRYV